MADCCDLQYTPGAKLTLGLALSYSGLSDPCHCSLTVPNMTLTDTAGTGTYSGTAASTDNCGGTYSATATVTCAGGVWTWTVNVSGGGGSATYQATETSQKLPVTLTSTGGSGGNCVFAPTCTLGGTPPACKNGANCPHFRFAVGQNQCCAVPCDNCVSTRPDYILAEVSDVLDAGCQGCSHLNATYQCVRVAANQGENPDCAYYQYSQTIDLPRPPTYNGQPCYTGTPPNPTAILTIRVSLIAGQVTVTFDLWYQPPYFQAGLEDLLTYVYYLAAPYDCDFSDLNLGWAVSLSNPQQPGADGPCVGTHQHLTLTAGFN